MRLNLFAGSLLVLVCQQLNAATSPAFIGPIPVQYIAPGAQLVLDMHRFYQPSDDSKLIIDAPADAAVTFDPTSFELRASASKPGIVDIPLVVEEGAKKLGSVLTLAVSPRPSHRFVFKPTSPAQKVAVAGAFNGWSADKNMLTGPDETGSYGLDLPLDAGRHSYKLVVNGKWILDPANSETEDNGLGDRNSVITVAGSRESSPTIFVYRYDKGNQVAIKWAGRKAVERLSAVFENEEGARLIKTDRSDQEFRVPTKGFGAGILRIVGVDGDRVPSNTIIVPLSETGVSPGRLHDAVMYYAFTDRFADGDQANDKPVADPNVTPQANFHGGDLRGIQQKIEEGYFSSLGVDTVWIAPLNRNPARAYREYPEPHRWYTGYHGYWPVSSNEIDPHAGTPTDLKALVNAAHGKGMRVIADLVLHHVHEEHPWWKEHRDWFGSMDLPDGRKNLRLWDEQQFTTWFEPYLPSFNFANNEAVRALIDNTVWWANEYKLDGFRLDAVKHIVPGFWWKLRSALRERVEIPRKAPLYLVGETFKDRAGINAFVGPNMLDGQFDFPLYDTVKDVLGSGTGDMKLLDDALAASERTYGKESLMSPLIGNHDKGRFMAYADGDLPDKSGAKEEEIGWSKPPKVDDEASYKKIMLAQTLLMTIDGVPMIYYGDEIGMTGAGDPDNRRDMRFGGQVGPMENLVLQNMKKLGAIRHRHTALRLGSRRALQTEKDVYVFVRAYAEDRVAVLINRGAAATTLKLDVSPEMPDGAYVEELTNTSLKVEGGTLNVTIPPRAAMIATGIPRE